MTDKADEVLYRTEVLAINTAVDRFAAMMKERMWNSLDEGRHGWTKARDNLLTPAHLRRNVEQAISGDRQSAVDAANYAMMLWIDSEIG